MLYASHIDEEKVQRRLLRRQSCIRAPARVRSCEVQALCSSGTTKQPSLPCKVSPFFSDLCLNILLLVDSLSTRRHGHCITWEIRLHTVHHPLSSSLFQPYSFTSRTPAFMGSPPTSASPTPSLEIVPFLFLFFFFKSRHSDVQSLFTN